MDFDCMYNRVIAEWEVQVLIHPIKPVKFIDPITQKYIDPPKGQSQKEILTVFLNKLKSNSMFMTRLKKKLVKKGIDSFSYKEYEAALNLHKNRFILKELYEV